MPTLIAVSCAALVLGWFPMLVRLRPAGEGRRDASSASGVTHVERTDVVLLGATWILCMALTAVAVVDLARSPSAGRAVSGVALFLAGMAAWSWARSAQGRGFAQVARAPAALVTSGAYRFVRHPMYLATAAGTAGQAIAAGSVRGAALWLALAIVLAARSYREEALLRRTFGSAWDAYARRAVGIGPRH